MAVVSSLGVVCELPAVTRFFNGNPNLGLLAGGVEQFEGRAGKKRWDSIGDIVARGWDGVLSAIDELVTTPSVDTKASATAAAELDEPFEDSDEDDDFVVESEDDADDEIAVERKCVETGGDRHSPEPVAPVCRVDTDDVDLANVSSRLSMDLGPAEADHCSGLAQDEEPRWVKPRLTAP